MIKQDSLHLENNGKKNMKYQCDNMFAMMKQEYLYVKMMKMNVKY